MTLLQFARENKGRLADITIIGVDRPAHTWKGLEIDVFKYEMIRKGNISSLEVWENKEFTVKHDEKLFIFIALRSFLIKGEKHYLVENKETKEQRIIKHEKVATYL